MIREIAPAILNGALIAMALTFIIAKLLIMTTAKIKENYLSVFVDSMTIFSHQAIKNTFDGRLKKYLLLSNKVNMIFYFIVGAVLLLYALTWLIL